MNKMLVAIFDSEATAFEGLSALKDLHKDGEITLYASTVMLKDEIGKISVKQVDELGPAGTAVGFLTGGLLGLLGGPVAWTIGTTVGGLTGLLFDLDRSGISVSFVDEISKSLLPGKVAVVADIDESWTAPVDTRLHRYDAVVFRRLRAEVIEDQLNREAVAFQADLQRLEGELKQASTDSKAAIHKDIDAVKKQLLSTQERAKIRLDETKAEMEAKLQALQDQAKGANDRTKARVEKRIADVKADLEVRSKKLNQAWDLAKQALAA